MFNIWSPKQKSSRLTDHLIIDFKISDFSAKLVKNFIKFVVKFEGYENVTSEKKPF